MSKTSIYDIGTALLTTLEATHKAGYVFNDLKLDNLMVGYNQKIFKKTPYGVSMFSQCSIHLVDFGYATKYLMSQGKHILETETKVFRGNIIFASKSQLEFKVTSRKDDLISACYILVYLLNQGKLFDFDFGPNDASMKELFA